MQFLFLVNTLFIKSFFLLTFLKLKEDNDNLKEKQSKLEALVKTSEIEIENQTKKCAQLEHEISGKVCYLIQYSLTLTVHACYYCCSQLFRFWLKVKE